jgi:methylmalonyl-CoA mutase C-terminal domain/subunit
MNFRESMDRIAAQIMDERIRVVIAEPGPDGQGRGARATAPALLEAGMEIIGTSLRQTPETIVNAAPREGLRAIGLPVLPGARSAIVPETMRLLSKRGMTDVPVVSGRTVLNGNAGTLKQQGVAKMFQVDISFEEIVPSIRPPVRQAARIFEPLPENGIGINRKVSDAHHA